MDDSTGTTEDHGRGRRDVLRSAAGVGAVALTGAALAACGSGASSAQPAPAATGGAAGSAAGGIPKADVPVGRGAVIASARVVVTQPTQGTFKAFDVTCPHQGCAVSLVTEQGIICPCHGSVFDATTGERRSGPAQSGLAPRTVTVSGDELTVS
jgi:Rieske Fe-S protein